MNFLVCISKTPDTTAKISFKDNNTKYNEDGVQFVLNPYDEWYALVRAIELKEELGGTVTVVNVGDSSNDAIIRKAIAIGADKAIRVNAQPISSGFVAKQIAEIAAKEDFDIIFTGKETIDFNGSIVGSMIAAHRQIPFVSYVSKLEIDGSVAKMDREIEGGVELIKVGLPLVVSATKGMAEQRIPNMRGIMMAKRKPLDVCDPVDYNNQLNIRSFSLPEEKGSVTMVDPENMDELVRLLKEEAKAL